MSPSGQQDCWNGPRQRHRSCETMLPVILQRVAKMSDRAADQALSVGLGQSTDRRSANPSAPSRSLRTTHQNEPAKGRCKARASILARLHVGRQQSDYQSQFSSLWLSFSAGISAYRERARQTIHPLPVSGSKLCWCDTPAPSVPVVVIQPGCTGHTS